MSNETKLKPCPFCGEAPEFPTGDGTQYEIGCCECGHSMASVQISDLMEIEERLADEFINHRYGESYIERAKAKAIELWNTRAIDDEINELREELAHYKNQLDLVCDEGLTPADAKKLHEYNHGLADENTELRAEVERLKELSKAAEKYISECPCDPDIYPEQLAAWEAYQELKSAKEPT